MPNIQNKSKSSTLTHVEKTHLQGYEVHEAQFQNCVTHGQRFKPKGSGKYDHISENVLSKSLRNLVYFYIHLRKVGAVFTF